VKYIFIALDICYSLYNLTKILFVMYLQCDIEQIVSQLEGVEAALETQVACAAEKCEEAERRREQADSKLVGLRSLHEDLVQQHTDLQTSYDALNTKRKEVQAKQSAAKIRAARLEKQLARRQVLGNCRLDSCVCSLVSKNESRFIKITTLFVCLSV
jgi:hypothetical protein